MTTATLTRPGELAAVVPRLLGFVPLRSAVVLSLRGPRRQVGLLQRFDLATPAGVPAPPSAWEQAGARVAADGGSAAVLVLYAALDEPSLTAVVRRAEGGLASSGVALVEALVVEGERWRSALCADPGCCPRAGSPLPLPAATPALALVSADAALSGRAVLGSREQLAASVTPPADRLPELRAALTAAVVDLDRDQRVRGLFASRARQRAAWRRAATRAADPRALPRPPLAARLVVGLADPVLRDAVVADALGRPERLRTLAEALCRSALPPHDAPVCVLLATVAYVQGDGALARIAVERALADDPGYSWAQLLEAALDAAVPPELVGVALRAAGRAAVRRLARPA